MPRKYPAEVRRQVIDADELARARLNERWREFCLNAERYVAEAGRPSGRTRHPT